MEMLRLRLSFKDDGLWLLLALENLQTRRVDGKWVFCLVQDVKRGILKTMKRYAFVTAIMITMVPLWWVMTPFVCFGSYDAVRYKAIIERKPFGTENPPAGVGVPGQSGGPGAVEPYIKFIKISAFVRDDFSPIIRVGLVETKSNQSYMLAVGEESEGLRLVKADFENEKVLLCKDKQSFWLGMDGNFTSVTDDAGPAILEESPPIPQPPEITNPAPRRMSFRSVEPISPLTPGASISATRTTKRLSLRERRRLYEADAQKKALEQSGIKASMASDTEPSPSPSGAGSEPSSAIDSPAPERTASLLPGGIEMDKQLQEYQMQAIREGREPLPIPLTPEMDEQLVNEGVLPPAQ